MMGRSENCGGRASAEGASADPLLQNGGQFAMGGALLGHRVAIAHGDGAVLEALEIDGDAERGADLVLPAVELADGARVVVDGAQPLGLQLALDSARQLDEA